MIITELAVFKINPNGMVLEEIAEESSLEEV